MRYNKFHKRRTSAKIPPANAFPLHFSTQNFMFLSIKLILVSLTSHWLPADGRTDVFCPYHTVWDILFRKSWSSSQFMFVYFSGRRKTTYTLALAQHRAGTWSGCWPKRREFETMSKSLTAPSPLLPRIIKAYFHYVQPLQTTEIVVLARPALTQARLQSLPHKKILSPIKRNWYSLVWKQTRGIAGSTNMTFIHATAQHAEMQKIV